MLRLCVVGAAKNRTMNNEQNTTENLTASRDSEGWTVIDSDGGVWYPDYTAECEIDVADDPAAEAIRICNRNPMRGSWVN